MSKPKKEVQKKWRAPFKLPDDKEAREKKTKNEYKKLLRKAEFKDFKSEVVTVGKKKEWSSKQQNGEQRLSEKQLSGQKLPGQQHSGQQPSSSSQKPFHKENAFTKAERDRKKAAAAAAEAKTKARAEAEAKRKALENYETKKKTDFKRLSKKTKKGQPHMGSQMEVLLAKIEKQMQ